MLVSAGQEHHVTAVEPLEARQHVAGQRRVGMPDMRLVVDVIDRRRDVIVLLGHGFKARAEAPDKPARQAGGGPFEIGRASCRERVCQYGWISVVAVSLQK